jgi:hypothetical protein
MSLPGSEAVYTLLTLVVLAAALPALLPGSKGVDSSARPALCLSAACFLAGLAFFALVSIALNFNNCPNPTREHPYIREGRLMIGLMIPFFLLFVYGLDRLLQRFGMTAKFLVLAGFILAMLATEIATDWPAFSNPFNWYHLP